jgi:hypothetical protein
MLSRSDIQKLRAYHITPIEISQLNTAATANGNPQHINLDTEAWQNVLDHRKRWFENKWEKAGGTQRGYLKMMQRFYNSQPTGFNTIFTFLRAEYMRYIKPQQVDYVAAAAKRAAKQTNKVYKGKPRDYTVGNR